MITQSGSIDSTIIIEISSNVNIRKVLGRLFAYEKIILSTRYLVSMDKTCTIDIQIVKSDKNIF